MRQIKQAFDPAGILNPDAAITAPDRSLPS
jgi:FAD/FMN-containing dehydrogenase